MDPALRLLMRMQARAAVRRALRGAKTPKGAAFVVIGLLVFVLWLGPVIFSATIATRADPHQVRIWAPLALLVLCVVTLLGGAGDRVISFTPGEINFLFPGPFSRRELLLFKLARTLVGGLFSGMIISLVLFRYATSWPAAFVGGVLAMLLVQLLTLAVVMAAQVVGERAYSASRKVFLGIVVAALAVALVPAVRPIADGGWTGLAQAIETSTVLRMMFSPLTPFIRTFTAESVSDLAFWGAISAVIDAALIGLILRLDADYREASLVASQRVFDRIQRLRRGHMAHMTVRGAGARRTRLGMFPWLGGAGPTAWRQLTATLRTSRGILLIVALMAVGIVPMFFIAKVSIAPIIIANIWGTMFLTMMLKFDFRAEIDQMEWLKALPLGPTATAAGQLAVPVLFITVVQTLLVGAAFFVARGTERIAVLVALPMLLPFNLILIGVENLMFLLFPSRQVGAAPGDLGAMGRQIVFFIVKTLAVAVACGVATLCGFLAWFVTGESIVAGAGIAFVVLSAMSVSVVPLLGLAYKRFDPSRDTPT